jgi:hypothetical protein
MPDLLNEYKKDEFLKYLRPILERIKLLFFIDLSEETIGSNYTTYDFYKTASIETYKLTPIIFTIDDKELLGVNLYGSIDIDLIIYMKTLLGLGDNIDGFRPEFIDNKKNEFEAQFKEAVKKINDECAQGYDRNCRKDGVDANLLLQKALFE